MSGLVRPAPPQPRPGADPDELVVRHEPFDPTVEQVSRLLSTGTLLVIGLVAAGTALALASGRRPVVEPGTPLDPGRLLGDLLALRADAVLWLGLLAGVGLPTARTVVAFAGFLRRGDRRAALVAAGVLLALGLSALVALLTRSA